MRRTLFITLALTMAVTAARAEITRWWGQVSFRQRQEIERQYIDITAPDSTQWGEVRYEENNSKTRLGYQVGFFADVYDNITAGVTFRSGLGSVMWQDIDNAAGLAPGIQEAYIDWDTPYAELQLGKLPQQGNAMWDLYAAPLWIDFRQDDPTDGVFNDRISAVRGARLLVPVGPAVFRGTYHTDRVAGKLRSFPNSDQEDQAPEALDQKLFLIGAEVHLEQFLKPNLPPLLEDLELSLNGDFGWPERAADRYRTGSDSVYAAEDLWGFNLNAATRWFETNLGYGYNWRDSVFKSDFWDWRMALEYQGFRLTGRYQHNTQEHQAGIYKGHEAVRRAYHIYLNKTLWNLDFQPRFIRFITEVDGKKTRTMSRMEITTTLRF